VEPDPELTALRTALDGRPGSSLEAIRETERLIDFEFPPDFVAFFMLCDGGEGWWGDNYLRIDSLEDLQFRNTNPDLQRNLSDIVLFGGDGGGPSCSGSRSLAPNMIESAAGASSISSAI
jgi:SMI1 / KNR4 family (SUKH-1)